MSDKLIKEIKQKKPSLQELKIILKKNKITSREEIHELMMKHNLLKYIKKDKQFITMKKKADKNVDNAYKELSGNPFKNAMKSLKQQLKAHEDYEKKKKEQKNTDNTRRAKHLENVHLGLSPPSTRGEASTLLNSNNSAFGYAFKKDNNSPKK